MCSIFGVVSSVGPTPAGPLRRALTAMSHRGPDGHGIWRRLSDGAPWVAFAHGRLAIIDLSDAAAQPMQSADAAVCLTFNGEIYNYREIMQELAAAGYSFRSQSDTEVLLSAYSHWGTACLDRLNGMFAFAIWDERKRALFAARDRFGEKPLHYCWDQRRGQFVFGSEIKAFFAAGLLECSINDRGVIRYIRQAVLDGEEQTIYDGVHRLLPAHALEVRISDGRLVMRQWCYWSIPREDPLKIDSQIAALRFRELFDDSVKLRLRADVPVGTSLSGGLDSSALVRTIKDLGAAGGQKAFSARMSDPKLDEGQYISTVLAGTGIESHQIIPTAEDLRSLFGTMCLHMEEPFPATSMFAQFQVMRLARDCGVTVLLDGQGADELMAGYHGYFRLRYGDLARRGRAGVLLQEFRSYAALRNGRSVMSAKGLMATMLPHSVISRITGRPEGGQRFQRWWNGDWIASDLAEVSKRDKLPYFDRLDARLRHDAFGGPLQALLRYGDRNSMAWSRELRQPFLDHRLAEFLFSLGPEMKISQGMTKVVLRQAMRGRVPDVILDRHDKLGYQAPQGHWLSGSLRRWTENQLENTASVLKGRLCKGVIERFRSLKHPLDEWADARDVFRLITLGECVSRMQAQQSTHSRDFVRTVEDVRMPPALSAIEHSNGQTNRVC